MRFEPVKKAPTAVAPVKMPLQAPVQFAPMPAIMPPNMPPNMHLTMPAPMPVHHYPPAYGLSMCPVPHFHHHHHGYHHHPGCCLHGMHAGWHDDWLLRKK